MSVHSLGWLMRFYSSLVVVIGVTALILKKPLLKIKTHTTELSKLKAFVYLYIIKKNSTIYKYQIC